MNAKTRLLEELDTVVVSLYQPSMAVSILACAFSLQALAKALGDATPSVIHHILQEYGDFKVNVLAIKVIESLEYDVAAISVLERLGHAFMPLSK